jgi:acetyl-CoA acetyltransferase
LIASDEAVAQYQLKPRAKIIAATTVGVEPRIMGFAPAPAIKKLLKQANLTLEQMDVIELNEAFAAQALAVTRDLGLADDDVRINPNGGAIALGHPLGASGARLVTTALNQLEQIQGQYALCSMCIGVGKASLSLFNAWSKIKEYDMPIFQSKDVNINYQTFGDPNSCSSVLKFPWNKLRHVAKAI